MSSRTGRPSFFGAQISALRQGQPLTLFWDEWRTPLDLASAASGLLALLRSSNTGVLHLGGPERLSRLEMGQRLAAHAEVLGGAGDHAVGLVQGAFDLVAFHLG